MAEADGYLQVHLNYRATAWFILIGVAGVLSLVSWLLMHKMGAQAMNKARKEEREAVMKLSRSLESTTTELKMKRQATLSSYSKATATA